MIDFFSAQSICFFLISFVIVLSSLIAVCVSNIKVALFSLFATFFGIAGLYVMLYSEFLAILQVVIYVGAILVLLLFSTMLVSSKFLKGETSLKLKLKSFVAVGIFFVIVPLQIILKSTWAGENRVLKKSYDYVGNIGKLLLSDEFILLEVVGVLMLLALVGASIMIKEEKE